MGIDRPETDSEVAWGFLQEIKRWSAGDDNVLMGATKDLFENILNRLDDIDEEILRAHDMPAEKKELTPEEHRISVTTEIAKRLTLAAEMIDTVEEFLKISDELEAGKFRGKDYIVTVTNRATHLKQSMRKIVSEVRKIQQ
jgi:hypothetical protein